MASKYQVVILGAGPGGYLLAERIGKRFKTAIIEKDAFGGTCLNVGCIPSKALLYSRKVYRAVSHAADYGVKVGSFSYDHQQAVRRKDEKVGLLVQGVEAKVKANKVDIFRGFGQVSGQSSEGFLIKVNGQDLVAEKLVIATGSVPNIPPIEGLDELIKNRDKILTNVEVLALEKLPKQLVIIGGGVIGLEMAAYFQNLGPEIHVVEFLDQVGGNLDQEISQQILNYYQERGVKFYLGHQAVKVDQHHLSVKNRATGQVFQIPYEKILLATGRTPNSANMGFEKIGLYLEKGAVVTNEKCQTNLANVYAIGDVNGVSMLAHTAYREAEVVMHQLLGQTWDTVDYNAIPNVIYTDPEIATVGPSEEELQKNGVDYQVYKMPMLYSGRFVTEVDDYAGLVKMLVDPKTRRILAVHMVGQYATEIIAIAGLMVTKMMSVDLVRDLVIPHPTVAELLKELIMQEVPHA
ncbi:dihydrolipoyl dehydrogenase [Mycoplasma sp. ATU-Cv-703]|uniref:dihydrolipoyl dehydrogenase n=1 Tax=Mycoplasma sp. ATU-Cv-703 TaxID=2498595 RepID=UPI000FDF6414